MSQAQVNTIPDSSARRLAILNEKYSFVFPASAKNMPRVADIMATDPNKNRETRIIFENGDDKLVFFAQELYVISGNNLYPDIQKEKEPEFNFTRQLLAEKDSLVAILSTPQLFDTSNAAILINSLLVRSPDNTVSRIDAFINPQAFDKKEEYRLMAENIFRTIQKEPRRVDLRPKTEVQTIFGTNSKLQFNLPEQYYLTVDEKYDFGVFRINKFKNGISDTTYSGISIYAGRHPNFFHSDYGYKFQQAEKASGQFLQTPVDWMYFKDDAQHFYLKEQVFPVPDIQEGLVLHVALLTNKKSLLEEMKKIIESVKLIK